MKNLELILLQTGIALLTLGAVGLVMYEEYKQEKKDRDKYKEPDYYRKKGAI